LFGAILPNEKTTTNSYRWHIIQIITVLIIISVALIIIFYLTTTISFFPNSSIKYLYIAIGALGGYLIIRIISKIIAKYGEKQLKTANSSALKNLFQIVAVLALAISVMFALGIDVTSALVGAGFLGIVLGLAAQVVMSNVFAGFALLTSKQFEVGDRITVNVGQYGFLAQTYVHDNLIPGYTGVVTDIGLSHTKLLGDDNVPVSYPNSALIQAMIFNHTHIQRRAVRIRVDVDRDVPINEFREAMIQALKEEKSIDCTDPMEINPVTISANTYNVAINAWVIGTKEEPGKAILIDKAIQVAKDLRKKAGATVYSDFPVRIGDQVIIRGEFGTVENVTPRYTTIKTWDNRRQVIPNTVLENEVVINYTLTDPVKLFPITFAVPYDTDVETAKKITVEQAQAHPNVLKSLTPIFQVLDFSQGAITLRLLFLAKDQSTAFTTACDLRLTIKKKFDEAGLKLSCPALYISSDSTIKVDFPEKNKFPNKTQQAE
jgi:small-conductance mechanosensitive channel